MLTTHLAPGVPVDQVLPMPQVTHKITIVTLYLYSIGNHVASKDGRERGNTEFLAALILYCRCPLCDDTGRRMGFSDVVVPGPVYA